jgi:short-subunit dehydrogenase
MYAASKHAVKGFTDCLRIELEIEEAPVSVTLIQPTAVDTPFPEHAKNYMAQEPDVPRPRLDPSQVAEAILSAAHNPARDVKVGMMARVNTAMAKFAPRIADKVAAKQREKLHQEIPPRNPEGSLHEPSDAGATHGRSHKEQQQK